MKLSFANVVCAGVGGGFVSATVVLESDAPVECRGGVEVSLTGTAWCEWRQGQAGMRGRAELFKHHVVLMGNADTSSGVVIAAGRHELPFAFALPECIPPSLTAKWGAIEYLLNAVCHSAGSLFSKEPSATLALDVHGSRWPRLEAAFAAPRAAGEEKKFFMQSQTCRALLQVDNPIGHVGSMLQGHVIVDNKSGKTIDAIGLKILQLVTWHAKNAKNYSTVVTSSAAKQLLPDSGVPGATNRTIPFQLTIPPSTHRPSVLNGTDCVVSVQHFVVASVKVVFGADFDVRVPFLLLPTPGQLSPTVDKPPTTPIAPVSVNPNLVAAMVDVGFEATGTVQISAPAPVLVSRVGKRTDKPTMAKK